jgi:tetratricopeptide (TPR) repeat protein
MLQRQGRHAEAQVIYSSVLADEPRHPHATHLLGVSLLQTGDPERAEALIATAIKLAPRSADFQSNYGLALQALGRLDEAIKYFERAIRFDSRHADAHQNLGVALQAKGDIKEAIKSFSRSIDIRPSAANLANLGVLFFDQGRIGEAISALTQAILFDPHYLPAYTNLANALWKNRDLQGALREFSRVLELDPENVQALSGRGCVSSELREFNLAVADLERAVQIDPSDPLIHRNLGNVLIEQRSFESALSHLNRAIELKSDDAPSFFSRGAIFLDYGRLGEAIEDFDRALLLHPGHAKSLWNKSMCYLQKGDFLNGWNLYEHRWEALPKELLQMKTPRPRWQPGDEAKRLLIWSEQGAGDEVFFSGALTDISNLSSKPAVQIDGRLMSLFSRSFPDLRFVPRRRHVPEDSYDVHLPIGSILPFVYRDLNRIPEQRKIPYLVADPNLTAALRQDLLRDHDRVVGITWQSKNLKHGASKSFALNDLLPILEQPGVRFVALQYGDIADELAAFYEQTGVRIDVVPQIDNFHDLDGHAALIEACDFIVSGCNTTAHVAGALNKPGFIAVPFGQAAFWYWHNQSAGRSFWYPSLRLFKHERGLAWAETMLKVSDAVNAYLGAGCE